MIPPLSSRLGRPLCFIQKLQAYGCYCLTEFQAHKVWQQLPLLLNIGRVSCKNQHMTETSLKGLLAAGEHLPSECRAEQGGQRGLVWMKPELKEWSTVTGWKQSFWLYSDSWLQIPSFQHGGTQHCFLQCCPSTPWKHIFMPVSKNRSSSMHQVVFIGDRVIFRSSGWLGNHGNTPASAS